MKGTADLRGWLTRSAVCFAMAMLTACSVARKSERSSAESESAKGEMSMKVDCRIVDSLLHKIAVSADSVTIVGIGHDGTPVARLSAKGVSVTSLKGERREARISVVDTLSAEASGGRVEQERGEAESAPPRPGALTLLALAAAVGILIALLIKFTKNFG